MTQAEVLSGKTFTMADQAFFARLSGDFNPIHLDPLAARRTRAGDTVVHGVHMLAWCLDRLASVADLRALCRLRAEFGQFVYVGETVTLHILRRTTSALDVELRVGATKVSQLGLSFGHRSAQAADVCLAQDTAPLHFHSDQTAPLAMTVENIGRCHGAASYFRPDGDAASAFPDLARSIGGRRITSLFSLTRLVGMICPGLNSIFHRIGIDLVEQEVSPNNLRFATTHIDPRFGIVTMRVDAAGLTGTIKASMRRPPVKQPSLPELRHLVRRDEFAHQTALIVGGSRGLGEFTAKLVAAGGGRAIITYVVGIREARQVADEIKEHGGQATVLKFDALLPSQAQLADLPAPPDTLYYFATQPIFKRRTLGAFSAEAFREFFAIHVEGFHNVCRALFSRSTKELSVFYPSSVAVQERPANMTEYAMVKAAGELLCADMNRFMSGIHVDFARLPSLATDQNPSMTPLEVEPTFEVMPPIIRRVQLRPLSS